MRHVFVVAATKKKAVQKKEWKNFESSLILRNLNVAIMLGDDSLRF
jgi:hypothetical protein